MGSKTVGAQLFAAAAAILLGACGSGSTNGGTGGKGGSGGVGGSPAAGGAGGALADGGVGGMMVVAGTGGGAVEAGTDGASATGDGGGADTVGVGGNDGGTTVGTGGAAVAGTGGAAAGTGGAAVGTGGAAAGTGGAAVGTGGAVAGTGGAAAGTGGAAAGTGGAGAGGSSTCFGVAPGSPFITGNPSPPGGATFVFAGPGLAAPVVSRVIAADDSLQALQATINPGATTDPANAFLGFGLAFGNPPCLDASAYTGVKFTVSGDLGTCGLAFSALISEDNSAAFGPFGTCTSATCVSPFSGPLGLGTHVVPFSSMSGGVPVAKIDPTALNGVQWTLFPPSDGVTAPCVASLTITDIAFVGGAGASQIDYTFDTGMQGWAFNTFDGTGNTNLAVRRPDGAAPPTLSLAAADGDPRSGPGALRVAVSFTALDQHVDAGIDFVQPGLDLSGRVLNARVRRVSGTLPSGGVQIHASSGPSFDYAGGTFLGPGDLPLGEWVPLALDLGAAAQPGGFTPSAVVQIGVLIVSGASASGDAPPDGSEAVFEIDSVVDAPPDPHKVEYTFDATLEGWGLSTYDDPSTTNLGAGVGDGGVPPTLAFQAAAGDPISGPGSLALTVRFSGLDQYVDAIVTRPAPGVDLSGRTLHAMVRLVSGSFPNGGVQIHASTGPSFVFGAGTFLPPVAMPTGVWVPLTLSLDAVTQPGFDPSEVVQIGVQFLSGFSAQGDVFSSSGDIVFEIDTVTD